MKHDAVRKTSLAAVLVCLVLSTGCGDGSGQGAAAGSPEGAAEEIVSRRATQRLEAMLAGDWDTARGYMSPALRQLTDTRRYAETHARVSNWTDAKVNRVSCEELRCKVEFLITYLMVPFEGEDSPPLENTRPLEDLWILVDGEWYVYEE